MTSEEHRPVAHRDRTPWPPERIIGWAAKYGSHVARVAEMTIARYAHAEQSYRACQGLIRCAEKYGGERADAACARALAVAGPLGPRRRDIEEMLRRGLDRAPIYDAGNESPRALVHENVRGGSYYDKEEMRDS